MEIVQAPCLVLEPIESEDTTIRIYVLGPDQQFPIPEIEPTQHFSGPAIVVERKIEDTINTIRYTLDDDNVWDLIQSWVLRMLRAETLVLSDDPETYDGMRKALDQYRL
jgi:hypothetical protein